jgi:protein O-mannosyl-transferase
MPCRRPYVVVGWFWYLGMLVPVIGLVQVGLQARADRYTYLPLIGVFMVLVWGGAGLLQLVVARASAALGAPHPQKDWGTHPHVGWYRAAGALAAILVLLALGLRTHDQLRHWQTSETLFRRAAAVTKDNWLAHYNLAETLSALGRSDEAVAEYERALAIHPAFARAQSNLGSLLLLQGQTDEAISHLQKAVEINPRLVGAHNNLGSALLRRGKVDEALGHLRLAVELDPGLASAHNSLGNILVAKGQDDEAMTHFQQAVKLRPDFARAHCSLAAALLRKGQVSEARAHYDAALAAQPANPLVLTAIAWALATCPQADVRNGPRAVELAQQAERSAGAPSPSVLGVLAAAYAEAGRFPEAASAGQRALELATGQRSRGQAEALRSQLAAYQSGSPFRDPNLAPRAR